MTTQQIEQGRHILKMIECLAGYTEAEIFRDHVNTLDEIDARFWCFFNGHKYAKHDRRAVYRLCEKTQCELPIDVIQVVGKVTRSRNALKAARPDGFVFVPTVSPKSHIFGSNQFGDFETPALPTEELAELHAITQARIWELENGGNNA